MFWFAMFALVLVIAVVAVEVSADWYPRPDGGSGRQYWDGEVWTDQTKP